MQKLKKIIGSMKPRNISVARKITAFLVMLGTSAASAQTLRHDSEALNRVRSGTESDSEYLSRLLKQSMSSVRDEHGSCTHYSGADGSDVKSEQDKKLRNQQVCALIAPLNEDSRFNFDDSDSGNICAPFWPGGKPSWERNREDKKLLTSYNTKNFVPPARQQLMKEGKALMTAEQKDGYFKKVEAIREKAAGFCCDSLGPIQQECTQAIRDVEIEICRDEASERDSSVPDSCAKVNASFNLFLPDEIRKLKQMLRDGEKAQQVKRSSLKEFKEKFGQYLESSEIAALNVVPGEKVVSGKIILSPYLQNGKPLAIPSTIGHEFMHACSNIRKQLDVKHNSLFADASMRVTVEDHKNTCEVSGATVESYGGMLSHFKTDGPGLSGCLTKLALKSTDPKSSVYIPSACKRRKVEEGVADAAGIFLVEPAIPDGYPGRACNFLPSTQHPHGSEVVKCMIANLPSYKKLVQEAFQCPASQQQ